MKKIFFLLCIVLILLVYAYHVKKEPLELLPLEYEDYKLNLLNLIYPTKVDRVKCNTNNEYKYCYNGNVFKKDIFGNTIQLENSEPYTHGNTFSDSLYQKVYLNDFKENKNLKGSSKTRDVFYDYSGTFCHTNNKWHLKIDLPTTCINNEVNCKYVGTDLSQCYSDESEASYQYDNYYYNLKDISKYPFQVEPMNPKDYNIGAFVEFKQNDKVKLKPNKNKMVYSIPLCNINKPLFANNECHPITEKDTIIDISCSINYPFIVDGSCVDYDSAIYYVNSGCNQEKPYKFNGECHESIDKVYENEYIFDYKENALCFLKEYSNGISCEDIYSISKSDISMLYNPITNNYIGQLNYGDYTSIECSNTFTKCIDTFPYELNHKNEYIPIYAMPKNAKFGIPQYEEVPKFKEPTKMKYLNPYNIDIHSNLYIQCKNNYSKYPSLHMCPKELPQCEGYVKNKQFGFCNENRVKQNDESLKSSNIHILSCKNNYNSTIPKKDMCPYNLPYCENNICKESSLVYHT